MGNKKKAICFFFCMAYFKNNVIAFDKKYFKCFEFYYYSKYVFADIKEKILFGM